MTKIHMSASGVFLTIEGKKFALSDLSPAAYARVTDDLIKIKFGQGLRRKAV